MAFCSRRAFLRNILAAGAASGGAGFFSGCPAFQSPPYTPTQRNARVVAVQSLNIRAMVRDIVDAFGGIHAIIAPGDRVFLKPNMFTAGWISLNPILSGECTKPDVVIAVAEACLDGGAREVVIGDGAQVTRFNWHALPTLDGASSFGAEIDRLNRRFGGRVRAACLHADSPAWIPVPAPYTGLGFIRVSSLLFETDRIISIPVVKTHIMTHISVSMKNFFGVTSTADYGMGTPSRLGLHFAPGGLTQSILAIVAALRPHFAFAEFTLCCEGNGPVVVPGIMSETVDMRERLGSWLMLGGDDLVAVDATASRIIGLDPGGVPHIRAAYNQGLGQMAEHRIQIDGAELPSLQVPWRPANLANLLAKNLFEFDPAHPPELWVREMLEAQVH